MDRERAIQTARACVGKSDDWSRDAVTVMVKPVYHRDREDAPFSRGLKAHLPLWMELVAKTAIIRLVDEYLKRHGLTEPRGSGPTAMVKAEYYRALRDGLIRSGARMPLDDFRATLKVVVEKAMQRGY